MELVLQQCSIVQTETLFRDDFDNNLKNWEVAKDNSEESYLSGGHYWMKNTSEDIWMYYKMKMPLQKKGDFIIDTEIEILSKDEYGHAGLVWGFDKNMNILNRFSISADQERFLVMQFDKNHRKMHHRFHSWDLTKTETNIIRLSIAKLGDYFHFFRQNKLVYTCNAAHFADEGPYFGYYVEPGISIRSSYMEVKKLVTKPMDSGDVISKLLT